jgi:hypothetical protein
VSIPRYLAAAALAAVLGRCASATPPSPPAVEIRINGQMIDRQFRELVVHATNAGTETLRQVRLEITVPESLPVIHEGHSTGMELRSAKRSHHARCYVYGLPPLAPGATVAAHFPFRSQALGLLAGQHVKVVARGRRGAVEAARAF